MICNTCNEDKPDSKFYARAKRCTECRAIQLREKKSEMGEFYISYAMLGKALSRCKLESDSKSTLLKHLMDLGGVPKRCPVLGLLISYDSGGNSPSLDRIDSSLGYIVGNVEIISYRANVLKNSSTQEERELLASYYRK